jgi:hypothetical protein
MRVLLAIAIVAALGRPTHACDMLRPPPLFSQLDVARRVAEVRITDVSDPDHVVMEVLKPYKGVTTSTIEASLGPLTDCTPTLRVGQRGLVIDSPAGGLQRMDDATRAAVSSWIGATTPAARAAVLVELSAKSEWRWEAAEVLARSPGLVAAMSPEDRAKLVVAARGLSQLAYALVLAGEAPRHEGARLASIAREVRAVEGVTATDELADRITRARGWSAAAIGAFLQCERVREVELASVRELLSPEHASPSTYAEMCRSGQPAAWWNWVTR